MSKSLTCQLPLQNLKSPLQKKLKRKRTSTHYTEEQVQQNLGNKTPPENPSEIVSESEAANAVAIGEKQTVTLPLDTRAKRMQMWDEMREWRDMEPGEARDKAERNFYQRYYGMDEGYKPRTFQQEIVERLKSYDSAAKTVLGVVADLPMDIIGNLPFGAALDDAYDEAKQTTWYLSLSEM